METTQLTLEAILKSQDLGEKGIRKACDAVLNNTTAELDPITRYISEQFEQCQYCANNEGIEEMINSLDYAIGQLQRAKNVLSKY